MVLMPCSRVFQSFHLGNLYWGMNVMAVLQIVQCGVCTVLHWHLLCWLLVSTRTNLYMSFKVPYVSEHRMVNAQYHTRFSWYEYHVLWFNQASCDARIYVWRYGCIYWDILAWMSRCTHRRMTICVLHDLCLHVCRLVGLQSDVMFYNIV